MMDPFNVTTEPWKFDFMTVQQLRRRKKMGTIHNKIVEDTNPQRQVN